MDLHPETGEYEPEGGRYVHQLNGGFSEERDGSGEIKYRVGDDGGLDGAEPADGGEVEEQAMARLEQQQEFPSDEDHPPATPPIHTEDGKYVVLLLYSSLKSPE